MSFEYVYLLQEREFINANKSIYKIGRTKQETTTRFRNYPKGTKLLLQRSCFDCVRCEKEIIKRFKANRYICCKNIGNEYFEGDPKSMIKDINFIVDNENDSGNKLDLIVESDCDSISCRNTESSESEEEEETFDYDVKIVVDTYVKFMKCTKIKKLVITDKTNKLGYLRFKDGPWRLLFKTSSDLENLLGYIQANHENSGYFINDIETFVNTKKIIKLSKNISYNYSAYKHVTLIYSWDKIIKDICNKCYIRNPKLYELKYHEYLVCSNKSQCIFNARKYKIYDSSFFHNNIIPESLSGGRIVHVNDNIDTVIVDNILNSLVTDGSILKKFKTLCYNVLVKKSNYTKIFYDYDECLLSSWLRDTMITLSNNRHFLSDDCYFHDRYDKKKIKEGHYRCIFISGGNSENYFETCIKNFKNIVISLGKYYPGKKKIYNIDNFKKYLRDNKELIMSIITRYNNVSYDYDHVIVNGPIDNIFYNSRFLFSNFLKWCVTP